VAASIAQAASTALPPRVKVMAPAVAASGLPVTATQCLPCNTGFAVACAETLPAKHNRPAKQIVATVVLGKVITRRCERNMDYPDFID
jgi:hypothetical protein